MFANGFSLERTDVAIAVAYRSQKKLLRTLWGNKGYCINKQSHFSYAPLQNAFIQSNLVHESIVGIHCRHVNEKFHCSSAIWDAHQTALRRPLT